jgi:U3 small nucleolar ribonucleoprotein protein IMP4
MTVVTTSRKPLPEVRSLARSLAFAIGGGYVTRGKAGMGELLSLDRSVVIVSRSGSYFCIQVFSGDKPPVDITVRSFVVEERAGAISRGLFTSDSSVYEALKGRIDAVFAGEDLPGHRIVFDGTQRKRYTLEVAP